MIDPNYTAANDREIALLHLLVERLGGHSVHLLNPRDGRRLGYSTGRHSIALCDVLALIDKTRPAPSPAAKGGDAVRSHDVLDEAKINALPLPLIARFAGDKDWLPIHDIGVDAPLCRIDVSGKLEPRRFSEIMELKDGDGVIHNPDDFYLDADTPTEGPASQAEGMGGEVNEAAEREAFEKWWPKHWPNAGSVSDNVWQGWMGRAALTPPETAEVVPVAWRFRTKDSEAGDWAGVQDREPTLAQSLSWLIQPLYARPDPEAARLREEVSRYKVAMTIAADELERRGIGQDQVEDLRAALGTEASR